MSEVFYEKFVAYLGYFFILLLILVGAINFIVVHQLTGEILYYYAYCFTLLIALGYAIKYFSDFKTFTGRIYLLIPEEKKPLEPLNMEIEDLPLKVCLQYRNGASFTEIEKDLELSHPFQAKRELVKGLDILLKSFESHNGEMQL